MLMKSGWALLLAVFSLLFFNACSSSRPITSSGFVWVATSGDQTINTYTIDSNTGAGSHVGKGVASGAQPVAMVMTPDRKRLFVANVDDNCGSNSFCNRIRAFTVNTDGTLAALGNPVQVTASTATQQGMRMALALDAKGTLLFVVSQGNAGALGTSGSVPGTISIFSTSGSGSPTAVPNSPFSSALPGDVVGNGPSAVAVAPAGNFVYVADSFSNMVAAYSYDGTAGSLNLIASYAVGANPAGLAFSRCAAGSAGNSSCTATDGGNLFVTNSGLSNNISIFTACFQVAPTCATANGTLQVVSGSPVAAGGSGPTTIIVSQPLNFVYVVDTLSNQVSQFSYNSVQGGLNALSPATISTGAGPVSGGITSDGTFVVVPDGGASDLAVFKVDTAVSSAGATPTGKLARASSPSITLTGQPSAVVVR